MHMAELGSHLESMRFATPFRFVFAIFELNSVFDIFL